MSLKSKIQSLISAGNQTTGQENNNLTDVIQNLIEGYGTGSQTILGQKTITANGTYSATDDEYDGYSQVTVNISQGGGAVLTTKNISANGTYNASSDSADGYSQVNVSVPASAVDSGTKNITANGNNQDVVGYAAVNVNVPNSYSAGDEGKVVSNGALVAQTAHADVTPTTSDQTIDTTLNNSLKVKGDADLVASNIKKDVEIFGVTGSYEGGGGGSSAISLLDTITVPSNTRAVNIDLTDYQDYNVVFIVGDIELTESDWLYFVKNDSEPTGGVYDNKQLNRSGIMAANFNKLAGSNYVSTLITTFAAGATSTGAMTNLYIYTYAETKSIKAGSTFKIYGGNYADM